MTNHRRSTLIACAVAVAAMSAAPATAAPTASGTLAVKAPTCSKTARASVTLIAKPDPTSLVSVMLVLKKIFRMNYGVPASTSAAALPGTGVTRRETAKVPVGTQLVFLAGFVNDVSGGSKTLKFKIAKCPKPKKPAYTG